MDQNGALVHRHSLEPGKRHTEYTNSGHVWAVIAKPSAAALKIFEECHQTLDPHVELRHLSPANVLIRLSEACLLLDKCTSLTWVPWQSFTISQRVLSQPAPKPKFQEGGNNGTIASQTIFQVMDIADIEKTLTKQSEI